jgi:carotene biosynthesis associated membrane protein
VKLAGRERFRAVRAGRLPWTFALAAVGAQIPYPLLHGPAQTRLTVLAVALSFAAAVAHAFLHRGRSWAGAFIVVAAGGGFLVEVVGLHTGLPFGRYEYGASLGPRLLGVPVVIPLAWAMLAYPALLVGRRLAGRRRWATPLVAGWALASWDVFLDPQMVEASYWRWSDPTPALLGVPGVPLSNYAGWLAVALVMMTVLDRLPESPAPEPIPEGVPALLYLWTYASQVLANLVFFDRPAVALAGGLLMGATAVPYAVSLTRRRGLR